jgi:hypothetical protein
MRINQFQAQVARQRSTWWVHSFYVHMVAVLGSVSAPTGLSRLELYGWHRDVVMSADELHLLLPLQRLRVLHLDPLWYVLPFSLTIQLRQDMPLLRQLRCDY